VEGVSDDERDYITMVAHRVIDALDGEAGNVTINALIDVLCAAPTHEHTSVEEAQEDVEQIAGIMSRRVTDVLQEKAAESRRHH
jgi:hypothetical protein